MTGRRPAEIVTPRNPARQKVRVVQGSVDELMARADVAVERLSGQFHDSVHDDVRKASALVVRARARPEERGAHLAAISDIAHEMRGQGTTFGYPLVTEIATSLFRFLDEGRHGIIDTRGLELVDLHVQALRLVIERDMKGAGDEAARQLVDGLVRASAGLVHRVEEGDGGAAERAASSGVRDDQSDARSASGRKEHERWETC